MPQSGSEDDDETWLMELTGSEAVSPIMLPRKRAQMEEYWKTISPFHPTLKTQSVAEPNLPRTPDPTTSANVNECDLPGPMSWDDDEDSSPLTQDLDLAKHILFDSCHDHLRS